MYKIVSSNFSCSRYTLLDTILINKDTSVKELKEVTTEKLIQNILVGMFPSSSSRGQIIIFPNEFENSRDVTLP